MRYDFVCKNCNSIFEITASPMTVSDMQPVCPRCNSNDTQKIITATNFILKAGGFYSKDTQENKE